jgi:hypothetical protein
MERGMSLPEELDGGLRLAIFDDCVRAIRRCHDKGYFHTDLRLPNVLRFRDRYEPVDFGEAVKAGQGVLIETLSDSRKQLVTLTTSNSTHEMWSSGHDTEMLARSVFGAARIPEANKEGKPKTRKKRSRMELV